MNESKAHSHKCGAAYGASNGYDDSSSGYGKDRDNMYGNHQHGGHGHNPNRLPQDHYNSYNHYKQPGHAAGYGHQHQFGGYNPQNQGSYHGANSQALNGGGFGRLP